MEFTYILLVLIFYLLVREKKLIELEYFENIFYNKFNNHSIYTIKSNNKDTYTLLTDYKFSETHKLGYEISKIYPININISKGMYSNLETINQQGSVYQLCFCTENDLYNYTKNTKVDSLRYICSFYRMEMLFFINNKLRITTIDDLIKLIMEKNNEKKKLRFGQLTDDYSSYHDSEKILNCMNIKNTDLEIIKCISIGDLIKKYVKDNIDFFYLTTTSKNIHLINFLKNNFINIIGIGNIKSSLIQANFDMLFKTKLNINKYNKIVKNNEDIFSYNSNSGLGNNIYINTYSTRLILVCRKEIPNQFIYGLLNTIYKKREILKNKMYKLYKNNKENNLVSLMDPFEMFYNRNKIKYHEGAFNLYKKLGFITYDKNKLNLLNSNVKSKLLIENNGPYELMFSRDK